MLYLSLGLLVFFGILGVCVNKSVNESMIADYGHLVTPGSIWSTAKNGELPWKPTLVKVLSIESNKRNKKYVNYMITNTEEGEQFRCSLAHFLAYFTFLRP